MAETWNPKDKYAPDGHLHDDKYSKTGHNHDSVYSKTTHNHDSSYAAKSHNHDSAYAAKSHDHDTVYSKLGHAHDYAASDHNHDTVYSKLGHVHDYSPSNHNHDSVYSKLSHSHGFDILDGLMPDYKNMALMAGDIPETEWSQYVFHIKVPGYFYLSSGKLAVDTDVSIVCSNSANNLINLPSDVHNGGTTYSSKCILWHGVAHTDDYGDNSHIWPLFVPGNSTYVRFVYGSTTDVESVQLCFIPCKYVTKRDPNVLFYTTTPCGDDNDKAFGSNQVIGAKLTRELASTIFGGDWTSLHDNM